MELIWKLSDSDITKVRNFVKANMNPEVEKIINRNINRVDFLVDKDAILRSMLICLISSDMDPYPEKKVDQIFAKKPYLLNYQYLFRVHNTQLAFKEVFQTAGFTKYIKKVPGYFTANFEFLEETSWELESEMNSSMGSTLTKYDERKLADKVDRGFKGFGSKEARSFLLALGVTRYEIPIDHVLIKWLKNNDFPIKFSRIALQDILFYHFVSDGIQKICEISEIYPCVLYTSILSGSKVIK